MTTGAVILVLALVFAVAFGARRRWSDGRFRSPAADSAAVPAPQLSPLADTPWGDELGERATLLQFSSAFCAPCRATRRILGEVAEIVPGVAHIEVDAEEHLELVRRLEIVRTPTTLVLDSAGHEVTRAAGAPTKEQVLNALARA